jgi:hypothetical protein
MSSFKDEYSEFTGEFVVDEEECTMSLREIQAELTAITDAANKGQPFDENRLDYLLKAQSNNEEYKELMEIEQEEWRESIREFTQQCLERTRTFIPLEIFDMSSDDMINLGISAELTRRILQRQCLWLCRMSSQEISKLHISDLLGRYNSLGQHMDIIETAAIFASLPEWFANDRDNAKYEYKQAVEENLRQMLIDNDNDTLPPNKIRNPAYEGLQFGPVKDTSSVRVNEAISSEGSFKPRRSFIEVCKVHSIVSKLKD